MKRILAMIMALVLCVSLLSVTAMATEAAGLSVENKTAKRGDQVTLAVGLYNNPGIAGMDLSFGYDATRLELVSIQGTGMGGGVWTIGTHAIWDNGGNSEYNGTIVLLTFKVKDDAAYGKAEVSANCSAGNWDGERVTVYGSTGGITITHDHVWGEWTVTKEATCTEDGSKVRYCQVEGCNESETKVIDALGHTWNTWTYNDNQHWHVCTRCGVAMDHADHVKKEHYDRFPSATHTGLMHYYCAICDWVGADIILPIDPDIDPVPGTNDVTPMLIAGTAMATISMVFAIPFMVVVFPMMRTFHIWIVY